MQHTVGELREALRAFPDGWPVALRVGGLETDDFGPRERDGSAGPEVVLEG